MEIFAILIGGAFVYFIGGCFKMLRMNRDVSQQQLAGLLCGVGRGELDETAIIAFFALHGWGKIEAMKRIAHALTLAQRISSPVQYEIAHKIAMDISSNYVELMRLFYTNIHNMEFD